jgi:cytoplasmic iron level regulating protein YaaA (DUF328/UPF0246 family)
MLILLSPAKTLDFTTPPQLATATQPEFIDRAEPLIDVLRDYSPREISELMELSDKLAALNVARYAEWRPEHERPEAKQAALAFDGDVYDGLDAKTLEPKVLGGYAQKHLGILSGLYGLLRPLDLIRPYRLEMGTRLPTSAGRNLYDYWGDTIALAINRRLDAQPKKAQRVVVNLASDEYFRSVRTSTVDARIVTPHFQDWKGGRYKVISFNAKRARGAMARFAIDHKLERAEGLKAFDRLGYAFDEEASDADNWIFRRRDN